MGKEEAILFPAMLELEATIAAGRRQAHSQFGSLANVSRAATRDQERSLHMVQEASAMAERYAEDTNQERDMKALLGQLLNLADDLRLHIHLESEILFPRVFDMEKGVTERQ
jgi:regulator of cell morphogenesis and NO signaling